MRWLKGTLAFVVILIVAIVAFVAIFVWLQSGSTAISYRFRLTIAVGVDDQVHSGSSVIEVRYRFFPTWAAGLSNGIQLHSTDQGQAVLIDLGARGVLVAALGGESYDYCSVDARYLVGRAYEPPAARRSCATGYATTPEYERALSQMHGPVDLTSDNMPAFFWFSDPANLVTAKQIKPGDFASVIGDSARLVSAQIEITHDPIVIDIDKKLPAYATLRGPPNDGDDYIVPGGLRLGWRQFISRGDE
jgi:hypothetical protein